MSVKYKKRGADPTSNLSCAGRRMLIRAARRQLVRTDRHQHTGKPNVQVVRLMHWLRTQRHKLVHILQVSFCMCNRME